MSLLFNFSCTCNRAMPLVLLFFFANSLNGQYKTKNYRNWMVGGEEKDYLALVIGNSEYEVMGRLALPAKDAEIVADALHGQGAHVLKAFNLDRSKLDSVILDFGNRLKDYGAGIIYFAGHGFQVNGINYLAPVDAHPRKPADMDRVCYNLDELIRKIGDGDKPKLICLDACRNTPFPPGYVPPNRGQQDGFTNFSLGQNSAFLFATKPRTIVNDDNPFAEAFAASVSEGGCLGDIVIATRLRVRRVNPLQEIWQEENLHKTICFGKPTDGGKTGVSENSSVTPVGTTTRPRGPLLADKDGDGIANVDDDCPEKPGFAGNNGCPLEELDVWIRRMNRKGNPQAVYLEEARKLEAIQSDEALARLGYLMQNGLVTSKGSSGYISLLKAAARQGNDLAAMCLGVYYGDGKLLPGNPSTSAFWLEEAAKNGRPRVRYMVGQFFHKGKYVNQNYESAVHWMTTAANVGFAPAENDLGVWYSEGNGVRQNKEKAFEYLLKAANHGLADAQFNIALAYYNGEGVAEDAAAGKRFMRMAADNGHAEAKKFFR